LLTSIADLEAAIARAGLQNAAALVHSRVQRGFHIVAGVPAPHADLGATRFGGSPDLPEAVEWPASADGAWTFFAQIALADLARHGGASPLPSSGLLSFFSGPIEGASAPVRARVLYTPPGATLARQGPGALDPGCVRLLPVTAQFSPALTLPVDDLAFLEAAEVAAPGGSTDALLEAAARQPKDALGMLLGAAMTFQENLQTAIAFDALGRSGHDNLAQWRTWSDWEAAKRIEHRLRGGGVYRPWSPNDDDTVRWIQTNRPTVDAEIAAWAHLLRINSHRAIDLWINDADPICFFARRTALGAFEFSDVRARVTQS
jgi:hypothetical protein